MANLNSSLATRHSFETLSTLTALAVYPWRYSELAMSHDAHLLVNKYLEHLRVERNYSPHTLRNYRSDLESFFGMATNKDMPPRQAADPAYGRLVPAGSARPLKVSFREIRDYLGVLYTHHRKPATVAR